MLDIEDRVGLLEMRVDKLATWAGPGQNEALSASLAHTRAELAKIRRTQDTHTSQLTQLKADVAGLKTDMTEVKAAIQEILRRLPPAA